MILYDRLKSKRPIPNYFVSQEAIILLLNNWEKLFKLVPDEATEEPYFVEFDNTGTNQGCLIISNQHNRNTCFTFVMAKGRFHVYEFCMIKDGQKIKAVELSRENIMSFKTHNSVENVLVPSDRNYEAKRIGILFRLSLILPIAIESGALKDETKERTKIEIKKARRGRRPKPSPYKYVSPTSLGRELVGERETGERGDVRAHFVRRHPRRCQSGKVTWVKAHVRGKGEVIQKTTKVMA